MKRRWLVAASIVLAITGACSGSPTTPSGSEVEYRILGTAPRASVSYRNATGGTTTADVNLPWSYHWSGARKGDFLYVSAFNRVESGSIKAQIFKQGALFRESESNHAFGFASVSGTY